MNSFVFFCFITFLFILFFVFLCISLFCEFFYVSEMYLDKFQDKQSEAKGLEVTMNSVIKQFRKRSNQYTNRQNGIFFVSAHPSYLSVLPVVS